MYIMSRNHGSMHEVILQLETKQYNCLYFIRVYLSHDNEYQAYYEENFINLLLLLRFSIYKF